MSMLQQSPRSGTTLDTPASAMTSGRLMVGFAAGFISVVIFSNGMVAILQVAGVAPFSPWQMSPTPPFGVPQTVSAAFWGGLWGMTYAVLEPKLATMLDWRVGGLVFGVLPLLVFWFVVLPMKSQPIGVLLPLGALLISVVLHMVFGLGTATFFRLGLRLRN